LIVRPTGIMALARGLTLVLWLASLVSVLGTLMLLHVPATTAMLGGSLVWLIRIPTLVYLIALPAVVVLLLRESVGGRRAMVMLLWGSGVGLIAELLGTTTGWPFGAYQYTAFLEPQFFGHVPVFIPLSWFAMSVVALWLATTVTTHAAGRVTLAATAMVGWDLALDPAMVAGWPVWVWSDPAGVYYGMPLLNLLGWWVTSAVILAGYLRIVPAQPVDHPWPRHLWILSAVLPLGLAGVRGLWPAVLIGGMGIGLPLLLSWLADRRMARMLTTPEAVVP
jgi:putative membrane protein